MIKLIAYPPCSTCKRAEKFLINNNLKYEYINIKENNPTKDDLLQYIKLSKKDINSFLNTSGLIYRANMEKIKMMSDDEKLDELSKYGMLVKRPLLVLDDQVLIGFKENEWIGALLK